MPPNPPSTQFVCANMRTFVLARWERKALQTFQANTRTHANTNFVKLEHLVLCACVCAPAWLELSYVVAHLILWLLLNNCCWETVQCYKMYIHKHYTLHTIQSRAHQPWTIGKESERIVIFIFFLVSFLFPHFLCVRPKRLINGHNVASYMW